MTTREHRGKEGRPRCQASRSTGDDATNAARIVLNSWFLGRQPIEESGSYALLRRDIVSLNRVHAFRGYSSHFLVYFRGNGMEAKESGLDPTVSNLICREAFDVCWSSLFEARSMDDKREIGKRLSSLSREARFLVVQFLFGYSDSFGFLG